MTPYDRERITDILALLATDRYGEHTAPYQTVERMLHHAQSVELDALRIMLRARTRGVDTSRRV